MLQDRNESPVLIGFPENSVNIGAIPFPTVTLCPETKANYDKIDIVSAYHAMRENVKLTDVE